MEGDPSPQRTTQENQLHRKPTRWVPAERLGHFRFPVFA